jgi:hypothetical protein
MVIIIICIATIVLMLVVQVVFLVVLPGMAKYLIYSGSPDMPIATPALPMSITPPQPTELISKGAASEEAWEEVPEEAPEAAVCILRRREFIRWCVQHGIFNEFPLDKPSPEDGQSSPLAHVDAPRCTTEDVARFMKAASVVASTARRVYSGPES